MAPVARTTRRRQADRSNRVIRIVLTLGVIGMSPSLIPLVDPILQFLGDYYGRPATGETTATPAKASR